jgi:hypothetical protein
MLTPEPTPEPQELVPVVPSARLTAGNQFEPHEVDDLMRETPIPANSPLVPYMGDIITTTADEAMGGLLTAPQEPPETSELPVAWP